MSAGPKHRVTSSVADLLAIPEEQRFHELVGGEIVEKSAPSGEHGAAQSRVVGRLGYSFDRRSGGNHPGGWWFATEVEVRLGRDICRPDVVGWRRDRVPERPRGAAIEIVPDWICEILSPDKRNDLVRKKNIYHDHKVGHYWIADPIDGLLLVYRWVVDGYLEVMSVERGQRVRAEPFEAIEFSVGAFFGDDEED